MEELKKHFFIQISKKHYRQELNHSIAKVLEGFPGVNMAVFHSSIDFHSRNDQISKLWKGIDTFNLEIILRKVFDPNFRQLEKLNDTWMETTIEELKRLNNSSVMKYLKTAMIE